MPFVKLDTEILDSTIWMDVPAREVFITSLLLAQPFEFTEPQKQIEVGSLQLTGWEAPPGWYGFVPASGPGIVHRSRLDVAEGTDALKRLCSPEPESRSQAFDGRRMIRIDGGFLILNYMKYRDKDHSSAVRSARYRARLKACESEASQCDSVASHRDVTYARYASASAVCDLKSDPDPDLQSRPRAKRKAAVECPDGFAPNVGHATAARKHGVSLEQAFEHFMAHHSAKGSRFVSWDQALHTWLIRQKSFGGGNARQQSGTTQHQRTQDYLARELEKALKEEGKSG